MNSDKNGWIQRLTDQVVEWAKEQEQIEVVLLVGSYARVDARADSDIDLVILCESPGDYVNDRNWAKRFGKVESESIEDWGKITSVRVKYRDGHEVEYGFAESRWATQPLDAGTQEVLEDGYRVLFDRDGKVEAGLKL